MKKKLVQINVVCNGSTGRIMNQIQEKAIENGYEAYSFFGRGKPANKNCIKIDTKLEFLCHVLISRLFNMQGHGSILATYRLLRKIDKINPDIIHLHNIHGYYLNYKILFKYLKNKNIPVIWTLHDCWAFTGHCALYTDKQCDKWKTQCKTCKFYNAYPKAYFGKNKIEKEYLTKEKLINSIGNLTLTVPSYWLKTQVEMSFLKNHRIEIIHNFIDTNVFKPNVNNEIYEKYNIDNNKKIILGVAAKWGKTKGIEYFKQLSKTIDQEKDQIVMVGLTNKQMKKMPTNIIGIKRTENLEELVSLYSIADVFFNPSIQETFSMVTLEAIACGVQVIVMNSTATPELVDENVGRIFNEYDIEKIYNQIIEMINKGKNIDNCVRKAQKYDKKNYIQYINLYNSIIEGNKNE